MNEVTKIDESRARIKLDTGEEVEIRLDDLRFGERFAVVRDGSVYSTLQSQLAAEQCAIAAHGTAVDLSCLLPATEGGAVDEKAGVGVGEPTTERPMKLVAGDANESAPASRLQTGADIVYASTRGDVVVEGLLRTGDVYILAGEEKTGKSRSAHVMAYSIAGGRRMLDWPVPHARDVLFVEMDESGEDTGDTLSDALDLGLIGIDECEAEAVCYYTGRDGRGRRTGEQRFDFDSNEVSTKCGLGRVMADWREAHPEGGAIFVDCLTDVANREIGASYQQDKELALSFSSLAHQLDVAIVFIHHVSKWRGKGSVGDRLYGTRGLVAGVTGTMVMEPTYEEGAWTGKGSLIVKGRCAPRTVPIDSEKGFWHSAAPNPPEAYAPDDVVVAVCDWLLARRASWTGKARDLVEEAGLTCGYTQVTQRLKRGADWFADHGIEYSVSQLIHGYRLISLRLVASPAGEDAA